MLNQSGVTVVSAGTSKTMLVDTKTFFALPCKVANTGVTAGSDGRKVVKMGTPLYGNLEARDTAFTISGGANDNPIGILEHDVDVTAGAANASIVIFGLIDTSKLETAVATALASATPAHIILCK